MDEVLKQIHEAKLNNQILSQKNMRLHIQFSQAKSMQEQLRDIDKEKMQLESAVRRIAAEPFMNRDKGGQSTAKRIAELEEKLVEKDKRFKEVKDEEYKKQGELKALVPLVERLKGERDLLEKENKKLKEKFTTNAAGNFDEFNVYSTLFKMDPNRYAQTISDINQKPEAYPIWANMDFLERGNDEPSLKKPDVNSEIKTLRFEIMKLRHENKDFAAELEKA